jgi:hypothetical protein
MAKEELGGLPPAELARIVLAKTYEPGTEPVDACDCAEAFVDLYAEDGTTWLARRRILPVADHHDCDDVAEARYRQRGHP